MKKLTLLVAACGLFAAAVLLAADPWQSKPFTEWSDKDVQKILTNSPWAHAVTIGGGGGGSPMDLNNDPPRAVGGNASAANPATGPGVMLPDGQEGGRERRNGSVPSGAETRSFTLTVVWQSAKPVKQAMVRRRYGAEGVASVDAKKFLDENVGYLIAVSGLTPGLMRAPQAKSEILQRTTLAVKGKEPLHATDIVVSPGGKVTEAIFVFPKTTQFALEDKEVEFSTQLGPAAVKSKFHLKDMVVNGTLEI